MHFDFQQGSLTECLITKGEIIDGQGQGRAKPEGPTEGAGMAGRGPGPRGGGGWRNQRKERSEMAGEVRPVPGAGQGSAAENPKQAQGLPLRL